MKNIPRHLQARVTRALETSRVVNIVGPRQAGKTTLVRELLGNKNYYTLDDDGLRGALEADPYGQLQLLSNRAKEKRTTIVIDEVQRLPSVTLALKKIVDENSSPGQFLLTGSSDIFTSGKALDSLAGRIMTLCLRPLSSAEIKLSGPFRLLDAVSQHKQECISSLPSPSSYTRSEALDLILRGGYPEIRKIENPDRSYRYQSYLDSIIERDVAPIAEVRKPYSLRRLIDQVAARTAEELNVESLCQDLGMRKETVNSYIDILNKLGILDRLNSWASSGMKRGIKAPKLHLLDTGCASALRGEGEDSFDFGANPTALGHLLESFVYSELEKSLPMLQKNWRLYHWRRDSKEVDIVAECSGKILALFEMKAAASIDARDFRHINWFFTDGPGKSYKGAGFVFYMGNDLLTFGQGRIGLPISMLWSF